MDNQQLDLPSLDIKTDFDPSLEKAYKQAEESKNLTPLIKQELKYTILHRRHTSGQGDVVLDEKKPVIPKILTQEEVRKKQRRKEQNRRAAQRCREKKKLIANTILNDYLEEQRKTQSLQQEIDNLLREKQRLEGILNDHAFKCCRAITPTPVTPSFEDQNQMTFQYGVSPVPYPRDSVTPFQDQPDDFGMFPLSEVPKEHPVPSVQPTCTQTLADLSLMDLDWEDAFTLGMTYNQPSSPELQNVGRRSVSEYADPDQAIL